MTLFTIKYAPQNSSQIIGQDIALAQLKDFLMNYDKNKSGNYSKKNGKQAQKAVLLYGPIGTGKTSSVYAIAKELKYDLLEINSSDLRNDENMSSFLSASLGQQSLFFQPKIILIDEIDNISGTKDRGCVPALVKALEKATFPVIITANDPFESKFKELTKLSLMLEYQKVPHKIIAAHLQAICEQEKIFYEEKALNSLARQVDGDLRGDLIDLQVCSTDNNFTFEKVSSLSDRKRTESIINALTLIFKSSNVNNALPALENVDLETNEIFLWLDENLPKEYTNPKALAKAYELFSRADVFNGRIKSQQHWRFLVYINDLLTAGISSAKEERNTEMIEYKPTMRLLRIWQAKMKMGHKKEIAAKLAKVTHTSEKAAREQIPYFQMLFKGKNFQPAEIVKELDLSEEEVEWLKK